MRLLIGIIEATALFRSSSFPTAWRYGNPGELLAGLTPQRLREPHGPMPRNPLIAEPLYRINYVEKAETGTTDMIADCREAGLRAA
jgi:hypothetical protein